MSMEDVRCSWDITGHVVNDRWVIEHFRLLPKIGKMRVYFSDLFHGNEQLSKSIKINIKRYINQLH